MGMMEDIRTMKEKAPELAASGLKQRNLALEKIRAALTEHAEEIFAVNKEDLEAAREAGVAAAVQKRLKFDEGKLNDCVKGLDQLISLPDPLGKVTIRRELDEGLTLTRISCPIGVIGVIFEARPDAMVQISSLCIKSGNCAVLKGGKETKRTNRALFALIHKAFTDAGLPGECLMQAEQHSEIDELLKCHGQVDLLIPRGSNSFVQHIMDNTKIPVMGHADGICHIYVDKDADREKALRIITDAKTQYTAACNAVETLLVHRDIAGEFLPKLAREAASHGYALRGTAEVRKYIECGKLQPDTFPEYLDLIASVKLCGSEDEAIAHINSFGSHHTDSIITENASAAERFMQMVDSAGVYQNCSTRFADGFRYGFGAEVGISTGKIHARGPVGLEGLVSYKYLIRGDGHIVGDYASGLRSFHFRDL